MKLLGLLVVAGGFVAAPLAYALVALAALATAAAFRLARSPRAYLLRFAVTSALLASFFYAAAGPSAGEVRLGPMDLSGTDFVLGLAAAARLVGIFATFLVGGTFLSGRELLPYAPTRGIPAYVVGGLLRLGPTLRADADRLREAQTARGHRFEGRARAWLPLVVPLLVTTLRRGREQATALHLAGVAGDPRRGQTGPRAHRWATVVVLTSLAVAGRLALVAWPGVSLSFLVLFLAGVAYGPRVGFLVGGLERLATDLTLSGLHPVFLITVPTDALLGLAAGLFGSVADLGQRGRVPPAYAAVVGGAAGVGMTLAFSIGVDTATWFAARSFLPGIDGGASDAAWGVLVAQGLLFNIPSLLFNASLFAIAVGPSLRALRGAGLLAAQATVPGEPAGKAATVEPV